MKTYKRFRIVTPVFVYRWGYPMVPKHIHLQLIRSEDYHTVVRHLTNCLKELQLYEPALFPESGRSTESYIQTAANELTKTIAHMKCTKADFGGSVRKLYTVEIPRLKGHEFTAMYGRKVAVTGQYISARKFQDYESGYDDYEPAHIENPKRHVLYVCPGVVNREDIADNGQDPVLTEMLRHGYVTSNWYIEKTNLEMIK